MVRNHLKIAWRSLWQHRQYSAINITGLAVGISCIVLVTFYVRDEYSYDRYHSGADRIYRVARTQTNSNGQSENETTTVKAIAYTLRHDFPEVESATAIWQSSQQVVQSNDKQFYESRVYETDSNFFSVFDFPFLRGSAEYVLKTSQSIVLTKSAALKYFGTLDAVGKEIRCGSSAFFVEGVVDDVPSNSHFHFDFLLPLRTFEVEHNTQWQGTRGYQTYVKLHDHVDAMSFEAKLKRSARQYEPESTDQYFIQPLVDIHLTSKLKRELEQNGDEGTIRVLLSIAFIVIVVASINYVNLATARSIKRAKEVGVRKTSGADRSTLVRQFLTESMLTTLISFFFAVILTIVFLPFFENITGKTFTILSPDLVGIWILLVALTFVLGLISGFYPALYLSSINPVNVLKSGGTVPFAGATMRKVLVLLQFVISIGLLIGTVTMVRQLEFMLNKAPGFDKDHVIVIRNAGNIPNRNVLETSIAQLAGVETVGASTTMPGVPGWTSNIRADHSQSERLINFSQIDYEYLDAIGIRVLEGRNFSRDFPIDTINTIVLNETAVRELGLVDPVGQRMIWSEGGPDTTIYALVVGVVNDFHYASFREPIQPFAFLVKNNFFVAFDFTSNVFVRTSGDPTEIIRQVEATWRSFVPDRPFTYSFMDDNFRQWHEPERQFKDVFTLFTSLSLFIASIGLFGLVAFITERRRKEIGIRKVLGASAAHILLAINKEFVILVGIALVIAAPAGWYFARQWLTGFAYHAELEWWIFVVAGLATLTFALVATARQSFVASTANPIESIRVE